MRVAIRQSYQRRRPIVIMVPNFRPICAAGTLHRIPGYSHIRFVPGALLCNTFMHAMGLILTSGNIAKCHLETWRRVE